MVVRVDSDLDRQRSFFDRAGLGGCLGIEVHRVARHDRRPTRDERGRGCNMSTLSHRHVHRL